MEWQDLNQLVGESHQMLRRIIGEHVDIQLHLSTQPMSVHFDSSMMHQIIINLAVNARDAMPNGGRLTISTQPFEHLPVGPDRMNAGLPPRSPHERLHDPAPKTRFAAGAYACLTVADNGTGMTPDTITHIYEPFFTTKGIGQGTGLGLATVYSIVNQHAGWIEVESELGVGSIFRIYLPCTNSIAEPFHAEAPTLVMGQGETILVVEDDAIIQNLIKLLLERAGYRVLTCSSGAEAIALWHKQPMEINLLITDMVMPGGINGIQLIKSFRAKQPNLKAIIVSGYSSSLDDELEQFSGTVAFIAKPFELHAMQAKVRAALSQNDASTTLAHVGE